MRYLSKVSFDPRQWQDIIKILNKGLYHEHQLIWGFLPDDQSTERDFLYRREDRQALPFFYLLSQREPSVSSDLFTCQTLPFDPRLQIGDRLVFSLRANAVKSYKTADGSKRRIRCDIVKAKLLQYEGHSPSAVPSLAQIRYDAGWEWLSSQGDKKGFKLLALDVSNHELHRFSKARDGKSDPKQFFASMDFQGVLQVVKPDLFVQEALFAGLGRSKAFGCGLLLVKRA
ncbi:MAG: type I-E CRISPR-associated protein Cas6/Cse3/CasE [Proteobacteria bacterium]|nr:MAG: type I-E CRISPR-associated protein Cas6/Cse3/CasE [Pseudomonadota bacterium]